MVGEGEHSVHVVFDQHHGVVFFDVQQELDHAFGLGLAHARQRFVEQQHLRVRGQRHGDLQLPLLAVAGGACRGLLFALQAAQADGPGRVVVNGRDACRRFEPTMGVLSA